MKRSAHILTAICSSAAMLVCILDSKTALQGARNGLELCARSVIPSLFPFFVLSILLTGALSDMRLRVLRPIARFCKMPKGTESLLLVGVLGGYPVGAKCVYEAWEQGQISKKQAQRYLGFCSNAGPSFIFGICSALFCDGWVTWVLWGIHILSALVVGNTLPSTEAFSEAAKPSKRVTLPEALSKAVTAMLGVCAWVVLFRVVIAVADRWFLWLLPAEWSAAFAGILELTNGCADLTNVQNEGMRFILCASFLSFGGLCVGLQTISVVGKLGTGTYFLGKAIQGVLSCCMATLFASVKYQICDPALPLMLLAIVLLILKKTVAFPKRLVYNVGKSCLEGTLCYSERKLQSPAATAPVAQK